MLKIPDSGLQSSQCRMQVPPGRAVGGDPLNTTPSLKQLLRLGAEDIVPPGSQPLAPLLWEAEPCPWQWRVPGCGTHCRVTLSLLTICFPFSSPLLMPPSLMGKW